MTNPGSDENECFSNKNSLNFYYENDFVCANTLNGIQLNQGNYTDSMCKSIFYKTTKIEDVDSWDKFELYFNRYKNGKM